MLVEKFFMLPPARIHGSCHRLQKIAGQIAGQTAFEGGEVAISLAKLVPPARFQRATFRLGGGRSMQLSYGSTSKHRKACGRKRKVHPTRRTGSVNIASALVWISNQGTANVNTSFLF